MKIDFKICTWERITFLCKEDEKRALKFLRENPRCIQSDLIDFCAEEGIEFETERLHECDDALTPAENNGAKTIEALDENEKILWENGNNY